jgi:hypothetical protein
MAQLNRRQLLLLLLAAALLGTVVAARAQSDARVAEYRLKAAFIFRFPDYVDWPDSAFPGPDRPFTIGVLGADAFAEGLLKTVPGRKVDNRPLAVRRLRRGDSVAGLQVLFIGASENAREVLGPLKGQPVLTVTESEQAFVQGSMVNFVVVDDKVRFDVALTPAEQANLKISARLLSVARKVESRP